MRHTPNYADRNTKTYTSRKFTPTFKKPHGLVEGHSCVDCGWPIKSTSSAAFAGKTEQGERKFRHAMCPSLSERRKLRAEALVSV